MTTLAELLSDADLAIDTLRNGTSPAFRRAAADFLVGLAVEILAEVVTESTPAITSTAAEEVPA